MPSGNQFSMSATYSDGSATRTILSPSTPSSPVPIPEAGQYLGSGQVTDNTGTGAFYTSLAVTAASAPSSLPSSITISACRPFVLGGEALQACISTATLSLAPCDGEVGHMRCRPARGNWP